MRSFVGIAAILVALAVCSAGCAQQASTPETEAPETEASETEASTDTSGYTLAPFVEEDFPFITTTVDAREVASFMPERNVSVRGIALQLGHDTYATFDPDLLRMAVGWRGDFVSMETMAQVSYDEPKNKSNKIPKVLGTPLFGTGLYPGWMGASPAFEDPRPPGPNPNDVGRGPLSQASGQWKGLYVHGQDVVLAYEARGTDIREQPGSLPFGDGHVAVTRTIQMKEAPSQPLTLVLAEVNGGTSGRVEGNTAWVAHSAEGDSVTGAATTALPDGASLDVVQNRYLTLRLPAGTPATTFKAALWTGLRSEQKRFQEAVRASPVRLASSPNDYPAHWPEPAFTEGHTAPDTSAFVVDRLTLPLPNRWQRNVRVADLDFFPDGRAAVVTFSGDVWLVSGIDESLDRLRWKRYASGLYEPLSIEVEQGDLFVYGREGIVRLNDRDGDQEADFYESFSDQVIQSMETREWPLDMTPRPGGGFYVSTGAALNAGPPTGTSQQVAEGFRRGSHHAGTVVAVGPSGQTTKVLASGFREPYLGFDRKTGLLTASDQQGNFVPSTPVYRVRPDRYYGVPPTFQGAGAPPTAQEPITWIPHTADPSGASQVAVRGRQMGPLEGTLVHLSYARPGLFRILPDTTGGTWQGGALPLPHRFEAPTSKGRIHPGDGQLYIAGFRVWGSRADVTSRLSRLRYTGKPPVWPEALKIGQQGVLLRFNRPLNPALASQPRRYQVERWNYKRSQEYGSGHYLPETGAPGQERVPVAAAHLSDDRKALLLVLPDMQPVHQMEVRYQLRSASGQTLRDTLYLTVNETRALDLQAEGFGEVDWRAAVRRAEAAPPSEPAKPATATATARRGRHLYQETGCVGCHDLQPGPTKGQVGPSFAGLYGAERPLENGETVVADEAYLRRSILDPDAQITKGYETGMPAFEGILSEPDIESLVLFIKSLDDGSAAETGAPDAP